MQSCTGTSLPVMQPCVCSSWNTRPRPAVESSCRGSNRSNKSAALLKLKKVTKALDDAETCIKLKPDWDKGGAAAAERWLVVAPARRP